MEATIYHLALAPHWQAAAGGAGGYTRSTVGLSLAEQGFIHCSFADQVQSVADLFYLGRADVVLLTIDPAAVGAPIKVETVGADAFPHIYGPLDVAAVQAVRALVPGPDGRLDAAPTPIA
jgi:glutathione S-transferase